MENRFEVKDNLIVDTATNLEWQKEVYGPITFDDVVGFVGLIKFDEVTGLKLEHGWRLPTIKELVTLIEYDRCKPASAFPDMLSSCFWSASSYNNTDDRRTFFFVNFVYGTVGSFCKVDGARLYVRCVRFIPI